MTNNHQSKLRQEKRQEKRASAIGLVSDLAGEFLGISLDLGHQGVRFIVPNSFSHSEPLLCKFMPVEGENQLEFTLKLQLQWRASRNLAYDEVGAKIITVDKEQEWQKLVEWHLNNKLAIKDLSFNSARNISIRYAID